jgi:hypothetical protein
VLSVFLKMILGECKKHLSKMLYSVEKQAIFLEYYKIRKLILKKLEKQGQYLDS